MLVSVVVAKAFATNAWIIATGKGNEALIVDPGIGDPDLSGAILERAAKHKLKPVAVLLTHGHLDHTFSLAPLCAKAGVPAMIHSADRVLLEHPEYALSRESKSLTQGQQFVEPEEVIELTDGSEIEIAGLNLRFVHAPGHTAGSILCHINKKILISGDVLFAGSIGRTDLPTGSHAQMEETLMHKIWPLADELRVLPGHGEETTIGAERAHNPYLKAAAIGKL